MRTRTHRHTQMCTHTGAHSGSPGGRGRTWERKCASGGRSRPRAREVGFQREEGAERLEGGAHGGDGRQGHAGPLAHEGFCAQSGAWSLRGKLINRRVRPWWGLQGGDRGSWLGRRSPRGTFQLSPELRVDSGLTGGMGPGCSHLRTCVQVGEVGTQPVTEKSPEWQGHRVRRGTRKAKALDLKGTRGVLTRMAA